MVKWFGWFKTNKEPKYGVELSAKSEPLISDDMRAQAEQDQKIADQRPVSTKLSLPEASLVMNLLIRYVNESKNLGLQRDLIRFSAPKNDIVNRASRYLKSGEGYTAMVLLQTHHAISYVDQLQAEVSKLDARISHHTRSSFIAELNKGESDMAFDLKLGDRIGQLMESYQTETTTPMR